MTCSKNRFHFRPSLEKLESRLQPGSIITGRGGDWVFLLDGLLNRDQGAPDSPSSISQGPAEGDRASQRTVSARVHGDPHGGAVASVMPARSETSSLPFRSLVDNVATGFTGDDLGILSRTGPRNAVAFIPTQNSVAPPVTSTPGTASVGESRTGAAMPAQPTMNTAPGTQSGRTPGASLSASSATGAASPVALALDAPQPTRESATTVAAPVRTLPNLHVTSTHFAGGGIHPFTSQPVWASYLGGPGDDRLLSVALNPAPGASQPVVVTGYTQSAKDPTEFDAVIATFSTDGTTATVSTVGYGTGTRTEGHAVDVDSAGNIYVVGQTGPTADPGAATDLIARVDPTGNVTWTVSLTPADSTGVGNGIKLDAAGANLFLTGAVDGNLFVAKLTDLASAQPAVVYSSVFPLDAGSRVGNAVGPDSAGNADLAFTLSSGGDSRPGWAQVTADGASLQAATFDSIGPKAGMFGITVDASDNFYVTGAIGQGASPFAVLVVAKFDSTLRPLYRVGWSQTDSTGVRTADWIGRDIKIDGSGNAYMATVIDSGGGGNMTLFAVGPTGRDPIEMQGGAYGGKDDQNRAVALDTSDNLLYMVGFTNSPDFTFTSGGFQSTYGGDPYDGVVIQDQLS